MAKVLDGKSLADRIRAQIVEEVQSLKTAQQVIPGLAVVLVGNDEASKVYVRNKISSCEKAGIQSYQHTLSEQTSEKELLQLIHDLNHDPKVHGILVQLPLPQHLNADRILEFINPKKDVDGLHSFSLGRLVQGHPLFLPCTPSGVIQMLKSIPYDCAGKEAVVIGRSNIVGKPMALLLLAENATVSICHSKTKDLAGHVRRADIVVAAAGVPQLIKGDWIKPGAVVVDVGIHRGKDGKLVGDIDFESAEKVAGYISPVPGGVGPMTITMLLKNTLEAAKREGTEVKKQNPDFKTQKLGDRI